MDENGRMQPYMLAERERGVHFDVGHGSGSFWFRQAVGCFNQGFWPDTISTDLHHQNVTGPAIDLLYVASKFLAMGMPLQDVLYRVTRAPAPRTGHAECGCLRRYRCAAQPRR
jgi:dihydroorotase